MCLMSLDKSEAVPIDTHVWQIAKRDYDFASGKGQKSITDKLHRDIGWLLSSFESGCTFIVFAFFNFHNNFPCIYFFFLYTGDFFRKLWGPYAGWAQSVSCNTLSLPVLFSFDICCSHYAVICFQVLFCADLKKFQKLKERPDTNHLQKEENDKAEIRIAGKKTKIKEEDNKPIKIMKTKSARHKK